MSHGLWTQASNVQGTQPWNTGDLSKNNWWGWSIVPLFAFLQFILQKPSSLSVIIFSPARWDVTCSLLFYLVANLKLSLVWWLEDIITCIWLDVHFPPYVGTLIFRWVALISFGEEWHNNHHAFKEYSPHHGLKWWQLDMTWSAILSLEAMGLVTKVKFSRHEHMECITIKSSWAWFRSSCHLLNMSLHLSRPNTIINWQSCIHGAAQELISWVSL